METTKKRFEKDSMGKLEIPNSVLYGASTKRAISNFSISNHKISKEFIKSISIIKYACAKANEKLGEISLKKSRIIQKISLDIFHEKINFKENFPIDIFQTGSATSYNMNVNEVIANKASLLTNNIIGSKIPLHPNDDVNLGQSSNDTMPTALHISLSIILKNKLMNTLEKLYKVLIKNSIKWKNIMKVGRTHLMDATPITFGQEFSGYARQIQKTKEKLDFSIKNLSELAIGGTAVGTGLNTKKKFGKYVCKYLSDFFKMDFVEAKNHFEMQSSRDDCIFLAGSLNVLSNVLIKIAEDIRLLNSGPNTGIGELNLPEVQPGSSIMPGKVNPVMCEMLIQSSIYVLSMSHMVNLSGRESKLELNTSIPIIAYGLIDSINIISNGIEKFIEKCLIEIKINKKKCLKFLNKSMMFVTILNPILGYDKVSKIVKKAIKNKKTLKEIIISDNKISNKKRKDIMKLLDYKKMINPSN
jgi:fumarate hydratase class II